MPGSSVRVTFLGGVGHFGRNCLAIETADDMVLVDCGVMFPEVDMFGIDVVLPNLDYVYANKNKLRGLLITHSHEDHIGALPFLLREIETPVIGSKLAIAAAKDKAPKSGSEFKPLADGETVQLGAMSATSVAVTHSIPLAHAFLIKTPAGTILHTGDFKLDPTPIDDRITELLSISNAAPVRLMLSDSTNAERPGRVPSERAVGPVLTRIFSERPNQRFIVATFASHLHRIQQICDAAFANNRLVAFAGRSVVQNTALAQELGLLHLDQQRIVEFDAAIHLPPEELCVIATGSQGEPTSALSRMAGGGFRGMAVGENDCIVMSTHTIPGNEVAVNRMFDLLARHGSTIIHDGVEPVHVSGHGATDELGEMISTARPSMFVPIHGDYRQLIAHGKIAVSQGVHSVEICEDGDSIVLGADSFAIEREFTSPEFVYVDGILDDVGTAVLRDRHTLSQEGVVVAVASVDLAHGKLDGDPMVVTRGWVYAGESQALMSDAVEVLRAAVSSELDDGVRDPDALRAAIRKSIGQFISDRSGRRPVVLPVLLH